MKKILYGEGCSWTGGHLGDDSNMLKPGLADNQLMSKENESYRLPKLWPHKLAKLLNIENVYNAGEPGSSNDGIVRRTVENVLGLLEKYSSDEILVVVGWTSPERKDFFHRELTSEEGRWTTLQPSQNMEFYTRDAKDLKHFFDTYRKSFWQKEEFISRYVQQNLYLHYFLKSHDIEHLFYSSFYENPYGGIDDMKKEEYDDVLPNTSNHFLNLPKTIYKDLTFRKYVQEVHIDENSNNRHKTKFFADHHPTELGHTLWAEELVKDLSR